jgi:hypothetical protein
MLRAPIMVFLFLAKSTWKIPKWSMFRPSTFPFYQL